jgi:hypothetical protein
MTHCRLASFHHSFTFHLDETFVLRVPYTDLQQRASAQVKEPQQHTTESLSRPLRM